ncbi:MAG TPA: 3' terminal RNA ribose 2'-O-methyltransferase Hen1 [Propionicimonas sp.]
MLLTVTSTATSATDLGFLLHKHPAKVQSFDLSVGRAHVFYPEATDERCTAALLLEVDPIALVRGKAGDQRSGFSLAQYVNDRPYAASSMLAVALGRVYRTAIAGRCDARPDLPGRAIPLEIHAPAVPCRGGAAVAEQMFGPLGWQVEATPIVLDPEVPRWGDSRYVDLRLKGTLRLADALSHLYVLLPALDADKHYWVGHDEIDKLMRAGEGWLATHPDRERIVHRYLANQGSLATSALERLAEVDDAVPEALDDAVGGPDASSTDVAAPGSDEDLATDDVVAGEPDGQHVPLARRRLDAVLAAIAESGARSVVDLGCGEGTLLSALLSNRAYERLLGVDVSFRAVQLATRRLHLETLPEAKRRRIELAQSSVTYRDARVAGFDAAVLMEVIEHVDPPRLPALERAVLGHARPRTLIVTTPNADYNVRFATLPAGTVRHHDHRFEWGRAEFHAWADAAAWAYGYTVELRPVGAEDDEVGPPTQMAVFTRHDPAAPDGSPGLRGQQDLDAAPVEGS